MNKKFSTLVAVLLAAGAWTTLDAKVVEITTPVAGGSYLIGTGINSSGNEYTLLLDADGQSAVAAAEGVNATTPVWTLVEATPGSYKLQLSTGGNLYAVNGAGSAAGGTNLTVSSDPVPNSVEAEFTIEADGTLKLSNVASYPNNTDIAGKVLFLKLNSGASASLVETASSPSVIDFGVYLSSAYDKIPGFDLPVADDGALNFVATADETNPSYNTPVYVKTSGSKYLAVELKDGAYVIKELTDAPTAANALSASWLWDNGKLYSVAAEQADKTAVLSYVPTEYSIVTDPTSGAMFGIADGALTGGAGDETLYASAVLAGSQLDPTRNITGTQNIVGGDLKLLESVPSGYAVIALKSGSTVNYLTADANAGAISPSDMDDYEKYLWKVSEKTVMGDDIYYTFTSLAKDADGNAYQKEFKANTKYSVNGITLSDKGGNAINVTGTTGGTPAIFGFYQAFPLAHTQKELNDLLQPGFELTVKYEKDEDKTIENISVFQQKMYPKGTSANATEVELWDNEEFDQGTGAKKLVLDTEATVGGKVSGAFKWLTEKEINKGKAGQYVSKFQFQYAQGNESVITKLVVVGEGNVSILFNDSKYYLTTSTDAKAKLPYIKLGGDNIYPVKNLLGKLWNISYANSRANAKAEDEEYKLNGILAVTYDKNGEAPKWDASTSAWVQGTTTAVADYVASNTVAESAPEAQWLVTDADPNTNTFTLTNRENPSVKIMNLSLRERDGKFEVYSTKVNSLNSTSQDNLKGDENDIVYLEESSKADNFQGYMQTTENTLRSNNYHLGQYHAIAGNHNAYFVENHDNSHKIGAVADSEAADKWKLHFAMKADEDGKYTEVDTVKIITEYYILNKDGNGRETDAKKIKKDTLAILPYTFQKVENREFVAFNPESKTHFDYYACDAKNKDNSVGNYTKAARFALKVKPNGYNFIELNDEAFDSKVSLSNSPDNGYLEKMETYADDNNSIMVVEAADASEYHKIGVEWGDTISLYRDENNSQVLFEKGDEKSIVEKDTLSFLNIDNINQFNVNPAIFADTAYINRWDADGVLNTTYQYLLTLNPSFGLHTEDCEIPSHEPIIGGIDTVYGRFLVNLIDTANVYGVNHIHSNWYTNDDEAGEKLAKLSFVEGYHTNDTLYLTRQGGEIVKIGMNAPDFNVAKFAFRYVDSAAKTFKIQTQWKKYLGDENEYDTAAEFAEAYEKNPGYVSNEGYLKWINGTVVVTKGYENGDVFGIEENVKRDPVANETIDASSISVVAANGAVIIKGAEGKKVSISNVLGQTVANTVITSDEATISAPAGIVVVAVEGEAAVKAIVK